MKKNPKISQLKVFKEIVESGGMRAASRNLNLSQTTITRTISDLESNLGVELMIRGSKGTVLSDVGKIFYPRVHSILKEVDNALNEIIQLKKPMEGVISLGCSSLFFLPVFSSDIVLFHDKYPKVDITITEGGVSQLLPLVHNGELDFLISSPSEEVTKSGLHCEPFIHSQMFVLAHRDNPLVNSTSLRALKWAKWCLPSIKSDVYRELAAILFPSGQNMNKSIIKGNTVDSILPLVLKENYLTIGTKELLSIPYINQDLRIVPVTEELPQLVYNFIYSQRFALSSVAKKLMDSFYFKYQ
jgi:LysR family tdc operon transcriptional activator/LysR family transcriptional regulator of abg operon